MTTTKKPRIFRSHENDMEAQALALLEEIRDTVTASTMADEDKAGINAKLDTFTVSHWWKHEPLLTSLPMTARALLADIHGADMDANDPPKLADFAGRAGLDALIEAGKVEHWEYDGTAYLLPSWEFDLENRAKVCAAHKENLRKSVDANLKKWRAATLEKWRELAKPSVR